MDRTMFSGYMNGQYGDTIEAYDAYFEAHIGTNGNQKERAKVRA